MFIPAAQYLRTSRPFEEAYLEWQRTVIAEFAKAHSFRIIKTYTDAGRSGIVLKQRPAMQRLLDDILKNKTAYRSVLVYDVSRWGRFQDVDEAAHYEFLCKSSGVPVYYCNEPHLNDGTATGAIFKNMRRSQAGEFSRELSEKVFRAAKRVAGLGFRLGGAPGYGLRRMMISEKGEPLQQLASGEFKYSNNNRTTLVPGPKKEIELVREIFRMASKHVKCTEIADRLNRRGVRYHTGHPWNYYNVLGALTNPKYIGRNVWGRTSAKLKRSQRKVNPEDWTVKDGAFTPIVDARLFARVQVVLRNRVRFPWTDDQLLSCLKALLARKGKLSQKLIDTTPGMPSSATFYSHFGSLRRVYALIGYRPAKGTFTKILSRDQNETLRAQLFSEISALFPQDITVFHFPNRRRTLLRLDNGLSLSIVLCRSLRLETGKTGWKIYPTRAECDYITLLCRLTKENNGFLDFWLFPFIEKRSGYSFSQADPWFKRGKRLRALKDLCREVKLLSRLDDARNLQPIAEAQAGAAGTIRRLS